MEREIKECDECRSLYYKEASEMLALCPECAHYLYGCKKCEHHFEMGRCIKCYWDGSTSDFIISLKNKASISDEN